MSAILLVLALLLVVIAAESAFWFSRLTEISMIAIVVGAHALEEHLLGFRFFQAVHFGTGDAGVPTSAARGFWIDRVGLSAVMVGLWWASSSLAWTWAAAAVLGIVAADLAHHILLEVSFRFRLEALYRMLGAGDPVDRSRSAKSLRRARSFSPGILTAVVGYAPLLWMFGHRAFLGGVEVLAAALGALVIVANYVSAWSKSKRHARGVRALGEIRRRAAQGPPSGWQP